MQQGRPSAARWYLIRSIALGGLIGTSQPWSINFWMGGYDVDSLVGYMMGTLKVPFFSTTND
jgi:hypothetical protein